jgi:Asp-tRNA(Asn)/Glu-tRNA(Gln) amidotransferase A subunit family amidase
LIESGFRISEEEYKSLLEEIHAYRLKMRDALARHNLDAWITPAAPGTAPAGLESTGDPVMNLPWTQAGLPSLTVPAGTGPDGRLPLGAQLIGGWYGDERLLRIAGAVMASLES